jgi:hypothetical protein
MIKLDENFTLEADGLQWTLHYENKRLEEDPKTHVIKTVTSNSHSYHGELRFALKAYCDKSLKSCGSVAELNQRLIALYDFIDTTDPKKATETLARIEAARQRMITELEGIIPGEVSIDSAAHPDQHLKDREFDPPAGHKLIPFVEEYRQYPLTPDDLEDLL